MRNTSFPRKLFSFLQQPSKQSIPISPFSITPILSVKNRYSFCTNPKKVPKHKPKIIIGTDDIDEETIEDASIEKETLKSFKQLKTPKISNINNNSSSSHSSGIKSSLNNYASGDTIGLDDSLRRMIALKHKDPSSITKTMNCLWIANRITGIPFILLFWQYSSYILYPELIFAYLFTKLTTNIVPGSIINQNIISIFQLKYPLLNECKWSQKAPDPSLQDINQYSDYITSKLPKIQSIKNKVSDNSKASNIVQNLQLKSYKYSLKYGFSWDIADNTRVLLTLPIVTLILHYGGFGEIVNAFDDWNPMITKVGCVYICATYGARLTANFALKTSLTMMEKQYGLRNDSGEYFGNNTTNQDTSSEKISNKRPKKN